MFAFFTAVIILEDLLGNRSLLQRVQKVMFVICDWSILICFVCFCVSRFVACDSNDIMIDGSKKCNCM